jgi:alpha-L-rhamnosidase
MNATRLRCEYLDGPLCIDANPPRLSWVVESDARGARQTAYHIMVASTPELLAGGHGDLWDSGKRESDDSVLIPYGGVALRSCQRCYWHVRVWDEKAQPGPWSAASAWAMGLLSTTNWLGGYIGMPRGAHDPEYPQLRRSFDLDQIPADARIYVNALGYYELYVNGRKADDAVLTPAVTQFNKRSFYQAHDIKALLRQGPNCLGLWLGRGWYAEKLPGVVHAGPLVRAQLMMTDAAGALTVISTDSDWKCWLGAYAHLDKPLHLLGGTRFDARQYQSDWADADFDDSGWDRAVAVTVPEHVVSAQPAEPNRVQRRLEPVSVKASGPNTWLLDFGTNLTGWIEMSLPAMAAGHLVTFAYGDRLDGGKPAPAGQRDEYIAAGTDKERFCSRFTYHAFRYVVVTGLDSAPAGADVAALLIHTDYPTYGSFSCSNTLLTRIHDMVHYTLRCLSLGGYLVDCPHFERLGYGGDGQASTPTATTMFGLGALYTSWLMAWRDCQRSDGDMPHIAPNPWSAGGGPYWCGFIIAASWEMYQNYADRRILEVNYPVMQKWMGFVESHSPKGLLERWPNTDYRNWYLGDWARPGRTDGAALISPNLVSNCFVVQCCDWMERIATLLHRADDAAQYKGKAASMRALIHAEFYDPDRGTYADDTQTDLAYALLAGVTPDALRAKVIERLEAKIRVDGKGHLDVGLVGVPVLTTALTNANRSDLVFEYASKDSFPGWGHMLASGATTTWEHWDGERSHIHNCYNGIGVWFYRALAGIRPDVEAPGFKHMILNPCPVGDVTSVTARQDTVRGPIESAWRIADGVFHWQIRIPANTTATVLVPTRSPERVLESGKPAREVKELRLLRAESGRAVFELPAGRYAFEAPWSVAG